MSKFAILTPLAALALAACAHAPEAPPAPSAERDWSRGLDDSKVSQIAPVGPIESDQRAYDMIRRREQQHALGSKATGLELDEIINGSSQVLASSLAMPLFKAGVYLGLPRLIEKGCTAARRVTHSALRASGTTDNVLQACDALTAGRPGRDACSDGRTKLREAYALLSADKGPEAGKTAAEAVRDLRDSCPKMKAPLRTPVDPGSRGFLIVWVLHANKAPPTTFLAGESAPATAEAVNETFLRGVQALRSLSASNP